MTRATALMVTALLTVNGCATPVPTVDYRGLADLVPGKAGGTDAGVPYQLTDSRLVIGLVPTGNDKELLPPISLDPVTIGCTAGGCYPIGPAAGAAPVRLAMAVVPIPFSGAVFAIHPRRQGLITTSLAPTYFPNSLRLRALAIEAKDHRIEVINAVGTIARGLAGVAAGKAFANYAVSNETVELHLPIIVDLFRARTALKDSIAVAPATNPGWEMAADFLDAVAPATLGFRARATADMVHHGIVTSVCRRFRLSLRYAPGIDIALDADVADPEWLVTIPFPPKGIVTFHPLCGADIQSQGVAQIGVDQIASAFVNNVNAIGAAVK